MFQGNHRSKRKADGNATRQLNLKKGGIAARKLRRAIWLKIIALLALLAFFLDESKRILFYFWRFGGDLDDAVSQRVPKNPGPLPKGDAREQAGAASERVGPEFKPRMEILRDQWRRDPRYHLFPLLYRDRWHTPTITDILRDMQHTFWKNDAYTALLLMLPDNTHDWAEASFYEDGVRQFQLFRANTQEATLRAYSVEAVRWRAFRQLEAERNAAEEVAQFSQFRM